METGSVDSPSREIRIVPAEKNADALASKPGPLGWGSGKAETIDRYEWRREE